MDKVKKIVIVEDNVDLSFIYKERMQALGYTCFVANDGITALQIIEKELPDLVLLDLMVPKIAGDQILATMRSAEWGKKIKVMIISNLNEADAPAGIRDLGIEGYAVKANLSDDQLDQLVDNILKPADQEENVVLDGANSEPAQAPQSAPVIQTSSPAEAPANLPPVQPDTSPISTAANDEPATPAVPNPVVTVEPSLPQPTQAPTEPVPPIPAGLPQSEPQDAAPQPPQPGSTETGLPQQPEDKNNPTNIAL